MHHRHHVVAAAQGKFPVEQTIVAGTRDMNPLRIGHDLRGVGRDEFEVLDIEEHRHIDIDMDHDIRSISTDFIRSYDNELIIAHGIGNKAKSIV